MAVLLTGMHRSGTSMLAQWVDALGVPAAPGTPFPVNSANSEGLYEMQDVVAANDSWLAELGGAWDAPPATTAQTWRTLDPFALEDTRSRLPALAAVSGDAYLKDPRLCLLLPLWDRLALRRLPVVAMVRPHREVAMSLAVRSGLTYRRALALWADYNRQVIAGLADRPSLLLEYESSLADPARTVPTLAGFLESVGSAVLPGAAGTVAAAVSPHLRRHEIPRLEGSAERLASDLDSFGTVLRQAHGEAIPVTAPSVPDWVDEALDEMRELWTVTRDRDALHDQLYGMNRVIRRAGERFMRRDG